MKSSKAKLFINGDELAITFTLKGERECDV